MTLHPTHHFGLRLSPPTTRKSSARCASGAMDRPFHPKLLIGEAASFNQPQPNGRDQQHRLQLLCTASGLALRWLVRTSRPGWCVAIDRSTPVPVSPSRASPIPALYPRSTPCARLAIMTAGYGTRGLTQKQRPFYPEIPGTRTPPNLERDTWGRYRNFLRPAGQPMPAHVLA
jgi:hypothetical protein